MGLSKGRERKNRGHVSQSPRKIPTLKVPHQHRLIDRLSCVLRPIGNIPATRNGGKSLEYCRYGGDVERRMK